MNIDIINNEDGISSYYINGAEIRKPVKLIKPVTTKDGSLIVAVSESGLMGRRHIFESSDVENILFDESIHVPDWLQKI